jgi:hypothetical protein
MNELSSSREIKNLKTVKWSEDIKWLLELIYGDACRDITGSFQIPETIILKVR